MSHTLIRRIKAMTGDSVKFRHDGSIYPRRGKSGTIIPTWACIHILQKEGWTNFRITPILRCWRAVNPDGQTVDMSINTLRWMAVHAVYDNERNRQKALDTTQPV